MFLWSFCILDDLSFLVGEEFAAHRLQMPRRKRIMCNENVLEEFATVPSHRRCAHEKIPKSEKCRGGHRSARDARFWLTQRIQFKLSHKTVSMQAINTENEIVIKMAWFVHFTGAIGRHRHMVADANTKHRSAWSWCISNHRRSIVNGI